MTKTEWINLVRDALTDLGADKVMAPGAKLRWKMEEIARGKGFDVSEHLKSQEQPFGVLVGETNGVTLHKRTGSDMLVGLEGADRPPEKVRSPSSRQAGSARLRKDVWEAFTRLSPNFVYLPGSDRFVPIEQQQGLSIPVPDTTLEALIQDYREFIDGLKDADMQSSLQHALQHSANPLVKFRQVLQERGGLRAWASWRVDMLRNRVIEWAKQNNIEPRNSWFLAAQSNMTAHRALERLIPYLTTDEVRRLKVPMRAVEALLDDRPQD